MDKKLNKIIDEEVDLLLNKLSIKEVFSLLKENNLIDSLEKSYDSHFNTANEIAPENWKYFTDALKVMVKDTTFQEKCKEINCKLYSVKFFTNLKFAIAENAESSLKFDLKQYFPQIVTNNGKEFMDSFFALPFEFTSLVVRYLANVLCKDKKNNLTPQLKEAQEYFNEMQKKKNLFITEVNKISQGQSTVFSIYDAQELLDVKAFFEYNPINAGVLEYIMRILTNKKTKQKLEDEFGKFKIQLMRDQILEHASYIQFLQEIKEDKELSFFTDSGSQNKERDTTFDEFVMKFFYPEQYVPEEKEEEPVPETPPQPESKTPPATGATPEAPLTVEQPAEEELK